MASQIDPDPRPTSVPQPGSAASRKPARPAAPPPAGKAPPPAGQAKPPAAPAARPQAPVPAAVEDEDGDEPEVTPARRGLLSAMPAWAISMVVQIVALLVMALIAGETEQLVKPTVITSSAAEEEEEFSEFEEQEETPEETPEDVTDPVADMMVTTEVAVEPVEVAALADDLDAAPLAVELTDFGSETAPASDMMATIGAIGGTAGGLGGRAQAGRLAAAGGGGADTEEAVDRALKWIAAHQMPDGGWSFNLALCPSCMGKCSHSGGMGDARGGATAMALLPFLGRGYTHREGPYKKQIEAGIGFLVKMAIKGNGKAYTGSGNMYSQGLVGIALSECFAMSQDNQLAAPTQAVLNFIMQAQDPVGGGWRYGPRQPGDTSAVGWQIMALKSGNMAYLQVNPLTVKKAVEFLDSVQEDSGAAYGYTGPGRGPCTTAVGLLCRMYLGWKKDHPGLQRGALSIARQGPMTDLYYTYYATQIMHHMEGEMWISWNDKMKKMLLTTQSNKDHEAGSWFEGVNGGHGPHAAGRLYCTSLATMILEVYYRHLPIYKNQTVEEEFRE